MIVSSIIFTMFTSLNPSMQCVKELVNLFNAYSKAQQLVLTIVLFGDKLHRVQLFWMMYFNIYSTSLCCLRLTSKMFAPESHWHSCYQVLVVLDFFLILCHNIIFKI